MMRKILAGLLFLSLGLAACGPGAVDGATPTATMRPTIQPAILSGPDTPGTLRPTACPFALPDGLVEGQDVECGYLPVFENRESGDSNIGRTIRLAVAVFHPPGGATQSDPVIYLSGGPGASILELIQAQYDSLSEPVFATGRSLVIFDQRGIGLSQPALDCLEFDDLNQELLDRQLADRSVSEDEVTALVLASIKTCRDRLAQNADLSAYNSANSAADVHELGTALGFDQVNLWGGSYGTRLALEVMRRYPDNLRSVVLDAVYPPDVSLIDSAPANFHRSLTALFSSCKTNPVCAQSYPDLEKVLFETVYQLNDAPVMRPIRAPFSGEKIEARVNGDVLLALTFQLLYDSKLRYFIPKIIYDVSEGDFNYLDKVFESMMAIASITSRGMNLSVQCHEEISFSTPAAYQAELESYPEFAGMYKNAMLGGLAFPVCEIWSAGKAEASANQPVASDVPALILSGEFDPITPPAWGFHAAESLTNAFAFEFPGIGHGASIVDECPKKILIDFLQDPAQTPDAACIAEMQ